MKIYVLVRLVDSCRIETIAISDGDDNWEAHYEELVSNGWKLSTMRDI